VKPKFEGTIMKAAQVRRMTYSARSWSNSLGLYGEITVPAGSQRRPHRWELSA
jgi:hypothetical protein